VKPTFGLVPLEGVVPMSGWVDVVGPLARSVKDAAYLLDAIAGPSGEDPRTLQVRSRLPEDGYARALSDSALVGRRFGLVGEGWRTSFLPLAPETEAHYRQAIQALEGEGGEVVEDPFAGTDFIETYRRRRRTEADDEYDLAAYLRGLGPKAAFHSVREWEALTGRSFRSRGGRDRDRSARDSAQAPDSARATDSLEAPDSAHATDALQAPDSAQDPDSLVGPEGEGDPGPEGADDPPSFAEWRADIQALFRQVMETHDLDGLFFPQAGAPIPDLVEDPERPEYNPNNHPELPSNIVNQMGLPVVTLPFGYYEDGTPFVLAFIGDVWTEKELLAFAYDLEQATRKRRPPRLISESGR
jgi:Asp-tRNA(Asn)/Glu-tRNA(Gln) amidotransferase A subunit family amidase